VRFRQLSARGSDRATAYNTSSKLVRRGDQLYVTWLESPPAPGVPTRIMLAVCDAGNGALQYAFPLGEGTDNHCGAALALDRAGLLHAVIGAHHRPFLYRVSERPDDPASWSPSEALGPADTYPSLAVDTSGMLHLAHRERGPRWQLWYRRKRAGQPWEAPRPLAVSPEPGYNHFMQSLSVGPDGTLHLTFQYHYAPSGRAEDCMGRAAVYLHSEDGGESWINEGRRCTALPLRIEDARAICHFPAGGLRIGNHVVDGRGRPWLFATAPDHRSGVLWCREASGWAAVDLRSVWPELDLAGGRSSSLSRDASGRIWLAVATAPSGDPAAWFDPRHEVFVLCLDEDGNTLTHKRVTSTDPAVAHWLPALELWNWPGMCAAPPTSQPEGALWMLYTAGLNAGGIGGDNRNAVRTRVYLGKV
jgi:hypothetical protein